MRFSSSFVKFILWINPSIHVMSNYEKIDSIWELPQTDITTSQKRTLQKQAIKLYRGLTLQTTCDKHWSVDLVTDNKMKYIGVANSLLAILADPAVYDGVQHFALETITMHLRMSKRIWGIDAMYHAGTIAVWLIGCQEFS